MALRSHAALVGVAALSGLAAAAVRVPSARAAEDEPPAEAAPEVPVTPLRVIETTAIRHGQEFIAWVPPVRCDPEGSVFVLEAPSATPAEVDAAARAGRDLPLTPRRVLRISADGKKSTRFDPAVSPGLAGARDVATVSVALGPDGTLYCHVWATFPGASGRDDRRAQYLVGLDGETGAHRSELEVDWEEMNIRQFEVFGSGEFLLRGSQADADQERIAILPASGGELQDVPGWSGYPSGRVEEPTESGEPLFDQMTRGADGRIYFVEQDPRRKGLAVYAFDSSGGSGEVFELEATPGDRELLGLHAAGGRVAAMYFEGRPVPGSPGERRGPWWIAVYDGVMGAGLQAMYGPVKQQPACYERRGSRDRFTFVEGDKLVTRAP